MNSQATNRRANQNSGDPSSQQGPPINIDVDTDFEELVDTDRSLIDSYLQEHNKAREILSKKPLKHDQLLSIEASLFNKRKFLQHLGAQPFVDEPKYQRVDVGYNIKFIPKGDSFDATKVVGEWTNEKGNDIEGIQVIWGTTSIIGLSIVRYKTTGEVSVCILYNPISNVALQKRAN